MKKLATIIFTCIIGLSMTLCPALGTMQSVFAEEGESAESEITGSEVTTADGSALDGLDGMSLEEAQNDPEISSALEDPTFYRYYEIGDDQIIHEKEVDLDEVDKFLQEANANADGIDNVDNVETNGDITAMGGGVSGLGKGQTPSKYSSYNRYHCIDISWWQGKISDANWTKIKAAGVTHAIIRCGYSSLSGGSHNMDSTFANNVNGAYKAGIKVGVYYYSTAVSAAEAISEAQYVATILQNYKSKITLPVAYDYETGGRLTASVMKKVGTSSCIAFCDTIKASGYTPMVYANYNTLCNHIDYKTLQSKYKMWLANYTTNGVATTYPGDFYMWQYSSSGKVNGLSGNIDINYVFEPKSSTSSSSSSSSSAASSKTTTSKFVSYKAKTTSAVNYRTGPGTNYKKKGTYKKGTTITVVGLSGSWAKLSNGYYVYLKYLKKVTSSVKYPYTAKTTTTVNYRTGPGTNYKVKGQYKKGVKVTIKSAKNGWGRMSNGYYIKLKYVK